VRTAREAAREAIAGLSFSGTLDGMQVAARHAYAMTYESEYVQDWARQLSQGHWGGRIVEEEDQAELSEVLQNRYVR
jgi:RNA-dependent RNA polymerase